MDILSTIRIATVVGLSAIKIIGAILRVKEAKEDGLINHIFERPNNNQPCNNYNYPQMYSNPIPVAPMPQPMPAPDPFQNSRRNCYYNQPQPQSVVNNEPYAVPPTNVQEEAPSMSRRTMGAMPTRPVYPQYQYPTTYPTYAGSCGGVMERNDGSFWKSFYNSNRVNHPPGYLNQPNYYGQGWYTQNNSQELQWADKSLGEMRAGNQAYQQQSQRPMRKWTPMFNWNNPILCKTPQQWQQNGIVAMFYTEDGQPLYGPTPVIPSA